MNTLVGRYEVTETLGGGGFAITYLARDIMQPSKPLCVVKQLRPNQTHPRVIDFFNKEAAILEKLGKHPQIPQLLAHFQEDDNLYIVQEYIQGHNAPKGKYREATIEVGSFPPNAFGLYDMHGNVWEWCQDSWHDNYNGAPNDGSAWVENDNDSRRVLRGGSWLNYPGGCRSAYRVNYGTRDNLTYIIGFRVVCGVGRNS